LPIIGTFYAELLVFEAFDVLLIGRKSKEISFGTDAERFEGVFVEERPVTILKQVA